MPNMDLSPQDFLEEGPGDLHDTFVEMGQDAQSNSDRMKMALELMRKGKHMSEIPIDDMQALKAMYDVTLAENTGLMDEPDEQEFQRLFSTSSRKYTRIAAIVQSLEVQGEYQIADKLEKTANEFLPELGSDMSALNLAGEPQQIPQQAPADQGFNEAVEDEEPEEIEEVVTPKDIDSLLSKLESVMDAMGDDFDPDLIPVAKKIVKELLSKLDSIETVDETAENEENAAEEEAAILDAEEATPTTPAPETPSYTPALANITKSSIKLAQVAENLDISNKYQYLINEIDDLLSDLHLLSNQIK